MNILSNEILVFTQYDRLYELIVSEFRRTNNFSIFSLLSFLQLNQLSPEIQRDSLEQATLRNGMMPRPDILSMINEIDQQRNEIDRMKENNKKVMLILIRNQSPNLSEQLSTEERILDACERGDIDEISRLLEIEIEEGCFKYRLNLSDYTAKIIPIHREIHQEELVIPRSINYKNKEFIVTSLDERAVEYSNIQNIVFPENSRVRFIHDDAFVTLLRTIKLPPLLEKYHLRYAERIDFENILLWPSSRYITKLNNQLLIEKSDINSDVFDTLSLVNPSLQSVTIPDYITKISEGAFAHCYDLREVNFSENSNLQIIEQTAFSYIGIESITIPSHVKQICANAFYNCRNLRTINFAPNSELCSFNDKIFVGCPIENLTIPCSVKEIHPEFIDRQCHITLSADNHNLLFLNEKIIIGKSDEYSENYDVILYACCDIEEETIPDFVRIIGPYSFFKCRRLRTVHFSENSQLTMIRDGAFRASSLQSITIPSLVQQIGDYAFAYCENLTVNFAPNSELRSVHERAFSASTIQSLFIPNFIENLNPMFGLAESINRIIISPENRNFRVLNENLLLGKTDLTSNNYDVIVFASNDCVEENIPDYIKKIGSYAFSKCTRLRKVNFSLNSQLTIIDSYAFFGSSLEEITVPHSVTEIRERAFGRCKSLRLFSFDPNSELRIIGPSAFMSSSIASISIPPSVTQIQDNAFSDCDLRSIVFPENSQLQQVGNHLFYSTTIQNATIPQHLAGMIRINQ